MITVICPNRTHDAFGSGHYGAPRGDRKHNGIDFNCSVGSHVLAPQSGSISKLGYAYSDDLSFRYVEITCPHGYKHRVFYISPEVSVGDWVNKEEAIGISQDLQPRYTGITDHVHYEIKNKSGSFINPGDYNEHIR